MLQVDNRFLMDTLTTQLIIGEEWSITLFMNLKIDDSTPWDCIRYILLLDSSISNVRFVHWCNVMVVKFIIQIRYSVNDSNWWNNDGKS